MPTHAPPHLLYKKAKYLRNCLDYVHVYFDKRHSKALSDKSLQLIIFRMITSIQEY